MDYESHDSNAALILLLSTSLGGFYKTGDSL